MRKPEYICPVCFGNLMPMGKRKKKQKEYECDYCKNKIFRGKLDIKFYEYPLIFLIKAIGAIFILTQPKRHCSFCKKNITWTGGSFREIGKEGEVFYCQDCFSEIPHPRDE